MALNPETSSHNGARGKYHILFIGTLLTFRRPFASRVPSVYIERYEYKMYI